MLPPTNDRWSRTTLVCAKGMLTKIEKGLSLRLKIRVRDGFEVSGQLIPDERSSNGKDAFTKFESG